MSTVLSITNLRFSTLNLLLAPHDIPDTRTRHSKPETLHPKPYSSLLFKLAPITPEPSLLNPEPSVLHPEPSPLQTPETPFPAGSAEDKARVESLEVEGTRIPLLVRAHLSISLPTPLPQQLFVLQAPLFLSPSRSLALFLSLDLSLSLSFFLHADTPTL